MSIFKNIFKLIYLNVRSFFVLLFKGIKFFFIGVYKIIFNLFKYIFLFIKYLILELVMIIKFLSLGFYFVIKQIVKYIALIFKGLYIALIATIKWIIKAIKAVFNALKQVILFLFKIIKKVVVAIAKAVKKASLVFFTGIYNVFKFIFRELYFIFKFLALAIFMFFKFVFFEVPKYILNLLSSFFYFLYNKIKSIFKKISEFFKSIINAIKLIPQKITSYFSKKWNNLALVKHYRNKKERELEVLFIDKEGKDAVRSEVKHTYRYLARNSEGKLIKGYFSALSKLDTHSYLLDEGYEVYEIKTSKWIDFIHGESKALKVKMKYKDLIFWLTQISTYVKSGIPLTDAIKILAQQDKRKKYRKIYDSIIYELTMGESFSKALEKQGVVFPGLLINMIAAAELIGDIESTLDDMANYYTELEDTRKSIVSAMTYPAIIFVFAIAVISFILIYIIPQFVDVYSQVGVALNPMTVFVLNLSDFIQTKYIFIILGIVVIVTLHKLGMKNLKAYKTMIQYIYMHVPVVGKIIIYNEINLFSKTFSALNKNNVLLTDSIEILSKITNNEIYKMIMFDTISNLLRGEKMSVSFKDNWAVPDIAFYMITTGESTGELPVMLDKVSDFYQKQQKTMVNALKNFIEPIMIVFLAVVVGGIILAVIVPLFSLYSAIQ